MYKVYISRGRDIEREFSLLTENSRETEFALSLRKPWTKYRDIYLKA